MIGASLMKLTIFISVPHLGHSSGSTSQTFLIHSCQVRDGIFLGLCRSAAGSAGTGQFDLPQRLMYGPLWCQPAAEQDNAGDLQPAAVALPETFQDSGLDRGTAQATQGQVRPVGARFAGQAEFTQTVGQCGLQSQ